MGWLHDDDGDGDDGDGDDDSKGIQITKTQDVGYRNVYWGQINIDP